MHVEHFCIGHVKYKCSTSCRFDFCIILRLQLLRLLPPLVHLRWTEFNLWSSKSLSRLAKSSQSAAFIIFCCRSSIIFTPITLIFNYLQCDSKPVFLMSFEAKRNTLPLHCPHANCNTVFKCHGHGELLEEEGDTLFTRRSESRQGRACLSSAREILLDRRHPLSMMTASRSLCNFCYQCPVKGCHSVPSSAPQQKWKSHKATTTSTPGEWQMWLLFLLILTLTDLERKIFL